MTRLLPLSLVLLMMPATARGATIVITPPAPEVTRAGKGNVVRVRVRTLPGAFAPSDFALLVDPDTPREKRATAVTATRYDAIDDESLALIVLCQGTEAFMTAQSKPAVAQAVDQLLKAGPPGARTKVGLMTYAVPAERRSPLARRDEISGEIIGATDYTKWKTSDLSAGLVAAQRWFDEAQSVGRRVLVVIGDGRGTIGADVIKRLEAARIEVFAVHVHGDQQDPKLTFDKLDRLGKAFWVDDPVRLPAKAEQVREYIDAVWWLDFPAARLPIDGRAHTLAVTVANERSDNLPSVRLAASGRRGRPFWQWFLIGVTGFVGLLGAIAGFRWLSRRLTRPSVERVPAGYTRSLPDVPAERRTMAMEEPRHTVALEPTGGEDAGGTVDVPPPPGLAAWLVTFDGERPTGTFVLNRAGTSVIGAGEDSHVRLTHDTVSKLHARVVARGGRFTLEDNQSKNGVWLNGKKVERVDLKDGHELRVGAVRLKFKTTA